MFKLKKIYGEFICKCGRKFDNNLSFNTHKGRCEIFLGHPVKKRKAGSSYANEKNKDKVFTCECGKKFKGLPSYAAHCSKCEEHLGYKPTAGFIKDDEGNLVVWNKGKTKDDPIYGESIKSSLNALRKANSLRHTPVKHSEETKRKISQTMKSKILNGEIQSPPGAGRGNSSYIIFNGEKQYYRSSFEFIFALYNHINNVAFKYETERVEYNSKVYISDFYFEAENKIIEIKGMKSDHELISKKAFENAGYNYEIYYWKEIKPFYDYLKRVDGLNIDSVLESISKGNKSKNYFVFNFDQFSEDVKIRTKR